MKNSLAIAMAVLGIAATLHGDDPQPATPRNAPVPFEQAREQTFAWAAAVAESDAPPENVQQIWQSAEPGIPARGVHDLVVRSFSAVRPAVAELLAKLDLRGAVFEPPSLDSLFETQTDEFFRTNLRLHVARALTDLRMFDEALALFAETDLELAVDPASALFYRAVCEHQLLDKEGGLATIATLLDNTDAVPESYRAVATLMQAELETLESDSLDEIARLMRDVERRLELARGGQRVQKKEDEIAEKLDEMIKKAEQQMSKSSSSSGGSGGQNQSSNPLGESTVKGSTAPGDVDPKDVRRDGNWGGLPPREREQAKNEIEKAFPGNYGRLINEYFLKRARGDRPAGD